MSINWEMLWDQWSVRHVPKKGCQMTWLKPLKPILSRDMFWRGLPWLFMNNMLSCCVWNIPHSVGKHKMRLSPGLAPAKMPLIVTANTYMEAVMEQEVLHDGGRWRVAAQVMANPFLSLELLQSGTLGETWHWSLPTEYEENDWGLLSSLTLIKILICPSRKWSLPQECMVSMLWADRASCWSKI
jgi:hypothetical protein